MGQMLWPPPIPRASVMPPELQKAEAAFGAEIRRIGEEVAAAEKASQLTSRYSVVTLGRPG